MTRSEFNDWLTYTTTCYPNLVQWFELSPGDTVGVWWDVLQDVDSTHATAAVRSMVAGDRESVPFSQMPAVVRKAARQEAYEFESESPDVSRPETWRCLYCKDSGWRSVVSPRNKVTQLRNPPDDWESVPDDQWTIPVRTCLVICDLCKAGEARHAQRWKNPRPVLFDSARMCEVPPESSDKQRFTLLQKFWREYKPVNRYTEFDAWAN